MKRFQESLGNYLILPHCIIQNKGGLLNEMVGPSYKHRFKNGTKITVISDSNGKPIYLDLVNPNLSDIQFVLPCLNKIRAKQNVKNLGGDKEYISGKIKQNLGNQRINYVYNH